MRSQDPLTPAGQRCPSAPARNAWQEAGFRYPRSSPEEAQKRSIQAYFPRHIRAVHKLLVRDLLFLTDLLDDGNRLAVCRIGLRTRLLDTESSAEHRLVGEIHFPAWFRMDAVPHPRTAACCGRDPAPPSVPVPALLRCGAACHAADRTGALLRMASDLLVVKQCDQVDSLHPPGINQTGDERRAGSQVIQART